MDRKELFSGYFYSLVSLFLIAELVVIMMMTKVLLGHPLSSGWAIFTGCLLFVVGLALMGTKSLVGSIVGYSLPGLAVAIIAISFLPTLPVGAFCLASIIIVLLAMVVMWSSEFDVKPAIGALFTLIILLIASLDTRDFTKEWLVDLVVATVACFTVSIIFWSVGRIERTPINATRGLFWFPITLLIGGKE